MNTPVRFSAHFKVMLMLLLVIVSGCDPQPTPRKVYELRPNTKSTYQDEQAKPTVVLPPPQEAAKYQPIPKKIINTAPGKAPIEIILGEIELQEPKISYNSDERKMQVTGTVVILSKLKQKLSEKPFRIQGVHEAGQSTFILREDFSEKNTAQVSAQAHCLSECTHVVVDVYILYNNKYYTEQIEFNRTASEGNNSAPQVTVEPEPSPEPPIQNELDDHTQTQQTEEADESIRGRYQGNAESIDLEILFPKEELIIKEKVKVIPPPTAPVPKSNSEVAVPPTVPTPTPERILSPELKQTPNGEVRPINQAIGFPDEGMLRNATSVLTRQQALNSKAFFEVVAPHRKKHFSTYELAELITRAGEQINKQHSKVLYLSNLSAAGGGKLGPHASHQNGLDADLAYPTDLPDLKFPLVVRMNSNEYFPKNYSIQKTYDLIKFMFLQTDIHVDRIFVDEKIRQDLCKYALSQNDDLDMFENIQHVSGHGDHLHLRIKCSKSDPGCRSRIYKKMKTCATSK